MAVRTTKLIEDRREQILPVLSEGERERLKRFGRIVRFAKGERLTTTGEAVPGMYVILAGHVAVRERHQDSVSDLARLEPGVFLADMGQLPHTGFGNDQVGYCRPRRSRLARRHVARGVSISPSLPLLASECRERSRSASPSSVVPAVRA